MPNLGLVLRGRSQPSLTLCRVCVLGVVRYSIGADRQYYLGLAAQGIDPSKGTPVGDYVVRQHSPVFIQLAQSTMI